ncbi:MAG: hypothetical protein VX498_05295, partial [Myxococcota bacterium]|nr:hypothetical protein [Myxococcota bacterium]
KGLADGVLEVRDDSLRAIDAQGEPALAPVLFDWFEATGFSVSDEVTRLRCVTLVAELDADYATEVLSPKLDTGVRSRMGDFVKGGGMSEWNRLAVEGLAVAATPEAIATLRACRTKGSDDFRDLVTQRLVSARRKAGA